MSGRVSEGPIGHLITSWFTGEAAARPGPDGGIIQQSEPVKHGPLNECLPSLRWGHTSPDPVKHGPLNGCLPSLRWDYTSPDPGNEEAGEGWGRGWRLIGHE